MVFNFNFNYLVEIQSFRFENKEINTSTKFPTLVKIYIALNRQGLINAPSTIAETDDFKNSLKERYNCYGDDGKVRCMVFICFLIQVAKRLFTIKRRNRFTFISKQKRRFMRFAKF